MEILDGTINAQYKAHIVFELPLICNGGRIAFFYYHCFQHPELQYSDFMGDIDSIPSIFSTQNLFSEEIHK